MKYIKLYLLPLLLMVSTPVFAQVVYTPSGDPIEITSPSDVLNMAIDSGYAVSVFDPDGNFVGYFPSDQSGDHLWSEIGYPGTMEGVYHLVSWVYPDGQAAGNCVSDGDVGYVSYDTCSASPTAVQQQGIEVAYPPPSAGPGFGSLITSANAGMSSTTGFDMAAVITFTGDNLIKLFIGSGLAVLWNIRYWLAALALIGGILYFILKVWRESNRFMK